MNLFGHWRIKMFEFFGKNKGAAAASANTAELEALKHEVETYKAAFSEIERVAEAVAKGDFSKRIISWDEFGELSKTLAQLNQSYDLADAFVREAGASLHAALNKNYYRRFLTHGILGDLGRGAQIINEASDAMAAAERQRKEELNTIAQQFELDVMQAMDTLAATAEQTSESATRLTENAKNNQARAGAVAAAAQQAMHNVQTVAAATEELTASVEEISQQLSVSSEKTQGAASDAQSTTDVISELNSASDKIGEVVKLINDIAEQTNLLALNATIEAARAGEAGKGFAVVAGEVKSLAKQTADATADISGQVSNIQDKTKQSVDSVTGISDVITKLNEIASNISLATEQQSAATMEISRNIQEASQGTTEVSSNIAQVNETAVSTLEHARELRSASKGALDSTDHLRERAKSFLASVRTL